MMPLELTITNAAGGQGTLYSMPNEQFIAKVQQYPEGKPGAFSGIPAGISVDQVNSIAEFLNVPTSQVETGTTLDELYFPVWQLLECDDPYSLIRDAADLVGENGEKDQRMQSFMHELGIYLHINKMAEGSVGAGDAASIEKQEAARRLQGKIPTVLGLTFHQDEETGLFRPALVMENLVGYENGRQWAQNLTDVSELNDEDKSSRAADLVKVAEQIRDCHQDLATLGIFQDDVKPDNVMIDANNDVKIIDFGGAEFKGSNRENNPVSSTLDNCAPEISELTAKLATKTSLDGVERLRFLEATTNGRFVFSLGMMFYQMFYDTRSDNNCNTTHPRGNAILERRKFNAAHYDPTNYLLFNMDGSVVNSIPLKTGSARHGLDVHKHYRLLEVIETACSLEPMSRYKDPQEFFKNLIGALS